MQLRELLVTLGDQLTEQEADTMFKEAGIGNDEYIDYKRFVGLVMCALLTLAPCTNKSCAQRRPLPDDFTVKIFVERSGLAWPILCA